jgi:S-adenosylmethionine hydrolase
MFISLLTDFGLDQEYAAVCKAVILSLCPSATIVDISHTVPSYDIEEGAFMLKNFVTYAPVGVHVVVIDPGVGTQRRGIAIKTKRGDTLVGPDNGVLTEAVTLLTFETGVVLENDQYMLDQVSASFHGRDVFAPAAAHIANGVPLAAFGRHITESDIMTLPGLECVQNGKKIYGTVVRIDRFGNIQTSIPAEMLYKKPEITLEIEKRLFVLPYVETFGDVEPGELLVYKDSDGLVTISQNQGNAFNVLHVKKKTRITVL